MFVEGHWIKATSMTPQHFFKWRSGEPNNYGHQEHCILQEPNGNWIDYSCVTRWHFVCYKRHDDKNQNHEKY